MKLLLIFLLSFISLSAFDYKKNINADNFSIPELNKIGVIQTEIIELQNRDDLDYKERLIYLKKKRDIYINIFIDNFKNKKYKNFTKNNTKYTTSALDINSSKFDSKLYAKEAINKMSEISNTLKISFDRMITDSMISLEYYKSNHILKTIFLDFQNDITVNMTIFNKIYNNLSKRTKVAELNTHEFDFFSKYYRLQEQIIVYGIVSIHIQKYLDKISSTQTMVNHLHLGVLINKINSYSILKETNIHLEKYLNVTMGVVGVIILVALLLVWIYHLILQLYYSIVFVHKKKDIKDGDDILVTQKTVYKTAHRPLKLLLIIFAIDIAQRVILYDKNNLDIIYYADIIYSYIFVWILFDLIDIYIDDYSGDFLKKFPNLRAEVINFLVILLKFFIGTAFLVITLINMNIDVTGILTSLGIGGLAIALAAKTSLENIFGSIAIIVDNMFSQGDWIVTQKGQGTVVEIGLRSTKVRTFDNALTYYPNAYLASTEVKNFSKRKLGRRIKLNIGIAYSADIKDIMSAIGEIREMLVAHDGIADANTQVDKKIMKSRSRIEKLEDLYGISKTLLVFLNNYSESSIDILVYCFSKSVDWAEWLATKEDVLCEIASIIEKNNLEFAFPSESLYLSNAGDDAININLSS